MATPASPTNQGIQWGGMIVGAAKITAAVAVATVASYFLYEFLGAVWNEQLSPEFKSWVSETANEAKDMAVGAWESVKQFFADLGSSAPSHTEAAEFVKNAWENDWVKGGTVVAALGAGAYGVGKWQESARKSKASEARIAPQTSDDSQAYREIKRRLDTLRAAEVSR